MHVEAEMHSEIKSKTKSDIIIRRRYKCISIHDAHCLTKIQYLQSALSAIRYISIHISK